MDELQLLEVECGERVIANTLAEEYPVAAIMWRCFLANMSANAMGFSVWPVDGRAVLVPRELDNIQWA